MLPIVALALVGAFALALDLHHLISFDALKEHRAALADFVAAHRGLAALAYLGAYAAAIAVSLPGALILTVTGGFLFGTATGAALAVVGATIGATILFLVARTAFGDALRARVGGAAGRMAEGFRRDALSYLLVLRIVPLFPFFVVNLACAFLGVPLRAYVIGTALGIVPGSVVYASVGAGLGSVFDRGESFSAKGVLTPEVIGALLGLAALALVPLVYRRWSTRAEG
ncbi:TVP38/TMEM64 family protein [Salinarimonas soli]|uniref:TVP38/TMEM64 family protein n=1 Tax=Salinarimonas soli TaxID=1638099 RepID=UPI001F0B64A2|nr:TVP38/TMEM64 family protein [Salinarimonas soli]